MRMFPRLIGAIGLFTVFATAPSARAEPVAIRASLGLTQIHMVTAGVGWAISGRTAPVVFRTTDGGVNWTDVLPHGVPAQRSLSAAFTGTASARVAMGSTSGTSIYRTEDGGLHWSSTRIQAAGQSLPFDLEFSDRLHGWLMVGLGAAAGSTPYDLFRTVDAGAHWTKVAYDTPRQRSAGAIPGCDCTRAITFRNSVAGWATGAPFATPQFTWLYNTGNGGRTWQQRALAVIHGYAIAETLPPVFVGNGEGYLPVSLSSGPQKAAVDVYSTQDGGRHWNPNRLLSLPSGGTLSYSFSGRHAWVAKGSDAFRSLDGGKTWQRLHPAGWVGGVTEMQFLSSTVGFAVAGCQSGCRPAPYMLRTVDGGRNWQRVSTYSG
jgi:photosystem II stability/assembly factor-like uncharacterized protein